MAKDSRLKLSKNGYYQFDKTINGKRERKSLKTKNYKEAVRLADKFEAECKFGRNTDLNGNIKVKDFTKEYLKLKTKEGKTENTLRRYNIVLNKFNEEFGNKNLAEITSKDIQKYLENMAPYSSKNTLSQVKSTLSNFFKKAKSVHFQYIANNPVEICELPTDYKKVAKKNPYISEEEFDIISKLALDHNHGIYIAITIQYLTGMRISEVLGLTWDNINLDKKTIKVKQQLYLKDDGHKSEYKLNKLKCDHDGNKERDIIINESLVRILKEQKKRQMQYRLSSKDYTIYKDNFVCTYDNGDIVSRANVQRFFYKIVSKELNRNLYSHCLRHTHITDLMHNPLISQEAIKKRVGHSTLNMTRFYTEEQFEANQKIADFIEKKYANK